MIEGLVQEYLDAGFAPEQARAEAEREARMTTGDPYLFRSDEELEVMDAVAADQMALARQTAGVTDEFPNGEFAVPGFNTEVF